MHHQHGAFANDARDRRDITKEIKVELVIERGVDGVPTADHEQV